MWFGSKDCQLFVLDNTLPSIELDKLIALGSEKRTRTFTGSTDGKTKAGRVVTNRVMVSGEAIELVRPAHNVGETLLTSLPSGTPIYCPIHPDRRPSAVVTRNKHGIHGVYCSSCNSTFWPKGTEYKHKAKPFDFDAISRAVRQLASEEYPTDDLFNEDEHGNLIEPTVEDIAAWRAEMDSRSFITTYCQYVPDLPLTEGITFLCSIKGSGKTEWIRNIVADAKAKGLSILLIGHRQSLLQSMSIRVGLDCYFYHVEGKLKNNSPSRYYAVCLDSMVKLLDPRIDKYDIILLDESEQVIGHTTQQTLAEKRRPTVKMFQHYLNVAKSVIYCDADLGSVTVELAHQTAEANTPVRFVLNDYKSEGKILDMYCSQSHLIEDMVQSVGRGGNHYIATNSKAKATELQDLVKKAFPDLRTRLVTSDQATDPDTQAFIANIKTRILNYGLVIASPSLGTGVDITFDGNAEKIDTVFGFFVPNVNTHFDIDQQLCRVRHAKAIKVWISPESFNFETDAFAIAAELIASKEANDAIVGYTREGEGIVDEHYLAIFSQVTAVRRASMNNLRANFIDYKERLGWKINVVDTVTDSAKIGQQMINEAKARVKADIQASVVSATQISSIDYNSLQECQKTQKLSKPDQDAMRRFELESFYRQPISDYLIQLDNNGRFRGVVRNAELYLTGYDDALAAGYQEAYNEGRKGLFAADAQNSALKRKVLRDLFKAAGLADGWRAINLAAEITHADMSDFVAAIIENKNKLETLFDMTLPRNLEDKPVSSVGNVLALIGLRLVKSRIKKSGNDKIRYYKVCPTAMDEMTEIIKQRTELKSKPLPMRRRNAANAVDWGTVA